MTDFIQRIKKTERRRILVCGLLAVIIFLLISNVVTHHTVKTLTEELDTCNSQYDALADEYDRLVLDSEALRDSNESLSSQLETLSARFEKVEREKAALASGYDDLQNQLDQLKRDYITLQAKYKEATSSPTPSPTPIPTPTPDPEPSSESESGTWGIPNFSGGGSGSWNNNTGYDSVESSGGTAWLSATGEKYHSIPNCGRMNPNTAVKTTVAAAEASGYEQCRNCW